LIVASRVPSSVRAFASSSSSWSASTQQRTHARWARPRAFPNNSRGLTFEKSAIVTGKKKEKKKKNRAHTTTSQNTRSKQPWQRRRPFPFYLATTNIPGGHQLRSFIAAATSSHRLRRHYVASPSQPHAPIREVRPPRYLAVVVVASPSPHPRRRHRESQVASHRLTTTATYRLAHLPTTSHRPATIAISHRPDCRSIPAPHIP
jgi:hypothetical protein